jgi:hypothetical protein
VGLSYESCAGVFLKLGEILGGDFDFSPRGSRRGNFEGRNGRACRASFIDG